MSNLLSIEQAFLNLPAVKQGLNLQEIRSVQRTITNAKKKKFEQTLSLSKLVTQAVEWFSSDEGRSLMNEEGITWTNEEIGQKVFGWQKSFFYKVVKAGKLQSETIDTFKIKCDEAEAQGLEPNRSLEGLLKFAKQVEATGSGEGTGAEGGEGTGAEGGEGTGEGEGTSPGAEVETRVETIFAFTYKNTDGIKVSLKIDANGNKKTSNTSDEIAEAIAFLNSQF
jgi:hypothetical protein